MKRKIIAMLLSVSLISASMAPVYGAEPMNRTDFSKEREETSVFQSEEEKEDRVPIVGMEWTQAPDTNIYYRGVDTRIEADGSVSCGLQGGKARIRYADGKTMTIPLWEIARYEGEGFSRLKLQYSGTGHPLPGVYRGTISMPDTSLTLTADNIVIKNPDEMPTIQGTGTKDVFAGSNVGNVRLVTGSGTKYKISNTFGNYGSSIYIYKMDKNYNLNRIASTRRDGSEVCTLEPHTVYYLSSGDMPGFWYKEKVTYKVSAVSEKTSISKCKISIPNSVAYTGKTLAPKIKVTYGKKTLKNGTDYTVSYSKNKNIGIASATMKGKGKYTGTVRKTFRIVPGRPSSLSAKRTGSNSAKISWKKSAGAARYQIVRSADGKKWTKVATVKTTNYTDKRLKKGTSYQYKVCAYRSVGGKNYYSSYSSVKTVK